MLPRYQTPYRQPKRAAIQIRVSIRISRRGGDWPTRTLFLHSLTRVPLFSNEHGLIRPRRTNTPVADQTRHAAASTDSILSCPIWTGETGPRHAPSPPASMQATLQDKSLLGCIKKRGPNGQHPCSHPMPRLPLQSTSAPWPQVRLLSLGSMRIA